MKKSTWAFLAGSAALAAGAVFVKVVTDKTNDLLVRGSLEAGELKGYDPRTIRIENDEGMYLIGYLIEQEGADTTVLMLHDMKEDASGLKDQIDWFMAMMPSANILAVDMRAHGLSDGYERGLGIDDIDDVVLWNDEILNRFGDDHKIVLYGKGMGANAALAAGASKRLRSVKVIVSDGAGNQLSNAIAYRLMKENHLPSALTKPLIRLILRLARGKDVADADAAKIVRTNDIPTVFVHARKDNHVPFASVFPLFNKQRGDKELFAVAEDHFYDMNMDDDYAQTMIDFVREYV